MVNVGKRSGDGGISERTKVIAVCGVVALLVAAIAGGLAYDSHRNAQAEAQVANVAPATIDPATLPGNTARPSLTLPPNPRVLFVGDSFTEGHGADDKKTRGFAPRLAGIEGWTNYRVDGIGLTGFLRPGVNEESHRTYAERIQRAYEAGEPAPDLVIFQGGLNDSRYDSGPLFNAVRDTITQTRGYWPNTQIVLVGPMSYRSSLNKVNSAYSSAAAETFAVYIDVNRNPIISKERSKELSIADGWHPNDAGHQMIAEALATRIAEFEPSQ
ncbi:SGNH/GDSL hydrolase family protein [Rhodococcus sp. BP-110]|nr:SGNH/GDSL hydrolase family protein [Rhodococcus sp. BP-110]